VENVNVFWGGSQHIPLSQGFHQFVRNGMAGASTANTQCFTICDQFGCLSRSNNFGFHLFKFLSVFIGTDGIAIKSFSLFVNISTWRFHMTFFYFKQKKNNANTPPDNIYRNWYISTMEKVGSVSFIPGSNFFFFRIIVCLSLFVLDAIFNII
jgi:hypothetical protein